MKSFSYLTSVSVYSILFSEMKNTTTRRAQSNFLSMLAYFYFSFYYFLGVQEGFLAKGKAA